MKHPNAKGRTSRVLKTFSERHRRYLAAVLREIKQFYRENLLGLAIFGSYARQENRLNSDLDLLIILEKAPGLSCRLEEFVEHVEMKHEALAQEMYEQEGIFCELSPYILTLEEALKLQSIYFDLVDHHLILYDPRGLLARIISSTRKFLEQAGAKKEREGNTWEWDITKFGFSGGVEL
ncbi:MAG: nucleotidyltransferase domain-containing protein [Firmicutes bacterium]|nr:nucleotidyltransferase domain-containing protein [Bacillota bacterium]